jgi:regulator of RNase E activity RraB
MDNNLEEIYKTYCKYNFLIANDDIFDSTKAYVEMQQWISQMNISNDIIEAMEKRLENDFKDGQSFVELETLSDLEYYTLLSTIGKISAEEIKAYMIQNNIDSMVLHNGIEIKKDPIGTYIVVFDSEDGKDSIGLDLFLMINKQNKNNIGMSFS